MPAFEWDEIPEHHQAVIMAQEAEASARKFRRKQFIVPPERFDPVFEARELVTRDYGGWTVEFVNWSAYKSYSNAPKPIRFGNGWGFHLLSERFRPKEPVELRLIGPNPELGYFNAGGFPALTLLQNALLVNELAFSVIQQIEPISDDRVLQFNLQDLETGDQIPYSLIDPLRIDENDIDYSASHMTWFRPSDWDGSDPGSHVWNGTPVKFGTVFKPGVRFHLIRKPHTGEIYISKDLLFTLYEEGVDLVPDYYDPHDEIYGHQYSPQYLNG
ncbi:MAG: hypothetical protein CMK07_14970 [Ponticaulis sp.]|nr:hypothetical protein [Ponticaulis sp.]